jgi:ribosome-associated heat shock protein Hsp15
MEDPEARMRLDLWLWSVRLYKTRTLAMEAIRAGHVRMNGVPVKPAKDVVKGAQVEVTTPGLTRVFVVLGCPVSRVSAALVAQYLEDKTSPEAYEAAREQRTFIAEQARVGGKPTKRDRRVLRRFREEGME